MQVTLQHCDFSLVIYASKTADECCTVISLHNDSHREARSYDEKIFRNTDTLFLSRRYGMSYTVYTSIDICIPINSKMNKT